MIARCALLMVLAMLQACSSSTPKDAGLTDATTAVPAEPGPMKAAEIMQALSNKSFQYKRGARSGVITFAADGTFIYQENGKGEGSGVWQASEGQLCEAFNPTAFQPKGTRSECRPFRWADGTYTAGEARYQPI